MSVLTLGLIDCPDIQLDFEQAYNDRPSRMEDVPLTRFLTSDVNTNRILKSTIGPGDGKVRDVVITYQPRYAESNVQTAIDRETCTNTNTAGMASTTCQVDIEVGAVIEENIKLKDIARICSSNREYVAKRLNALMDGLMRKIETDVTEQVVLCVGHFPTNDTDGVLANIKTVTTLLPVANGGQLSYDAISEIAFTKKQANYAGNAYVFGSNLIGKHFNMVAAACCADHGVDINTFNGQNGIVFMDSHRVPTALADTEGFLSMDAGSSQFSYVNLNEGETNTVRTEDYVEGVLFEPRTGLPIDFTFKHDCGNLFIKLALAYNVCCIPDDLYALDDRLRQVTGVNQFTVTNT